MYKSIKDIKRLSAAMSKSKSVQVDGGPLL
jgi:hypothetical protein